MDVIFETERGRPFSIEVGFFDTVLEIKEKVQKYQGIPVARQTLVFKGHVLQDEQDIEYCGLLQDSHVQLLVAPEPHKTQVKPQINVEQPSPQPSNKIQLKINILSSKTCVPLEMDSNDTILRLKEKVHEMETVPINRLVVQCRGMELQDNRSLQECQLQDNTQIDVNVMPLPTAPGTGSKKLKLMVLPQCGPKKIPVEVNPLDSVGELRKELQKLQSRLQFTLPPEGYFFIYKQNVMDDDRSFRWHQVGQGDTIEIFNGSVTEHMEVYVAYCHLTVPVRVPVTATVLDLKLKMETYLGLSVDRQDVFLGPQPLRLEDENILQNICQVRDGSTVFLRLKLQVWVKSETERYGLVVYTDNNVLAMKKRLGEKYGLKVENSRLALLDPSTNGLLVLDDRTVLHTISIHLREGIEFLLG